MDLIWIVRRDASVGASTNRLPIPLRKLSSLTFMTDLQIGNDRRAAPVASRETKRYQTQEKQAMKAGPS